MIELSPRHWRAARIAGFAAVTIVVVLALRNVDWPRTADALRQARPGWLIAAVIANGAILLAWAAFWRTLRPRHAAPVSYGRMLEIVSTSSSLMNTLPFGGGHASSVVLLIRRAGMTQGGALSVLALDQLGEGVAKVTMFLLLGVLVPLPAWMRASIVTVSLGVGAWLVALLVASRWARDLELLKSRRAVTALGYVLLMKLVQALAIVAVQHAYGVDLPASAALLVLATVVLATMIPLVPGNLGTYEAAVFLAYRYLGLAPEQALSLAIVQHVCFMLPATGVGYLFYTTQTLSRSPIASR
jgi:uncharacterized membrane protein YbhN (UPF0104 family)